MGFTILGTGSALPERSVSNDELSEFLDTSDEWIFTRTGIKSRHVCTTESLDERVVRTLRETGNISSACIPLALDRLANAGALHTGDTIALVGFGAGLDIGGYLLRWK